jgi:hypothetical protein
MTASPTRLGPGPALEEQVRGAWATYALSTADLEGREYEEAEALAWGALQRELAAIAARGQAQPLPPARV